MVEVSNKHKSITVAVSSKNGNTVIAASSDTSQYWANQSHTFANQSKDSVQEAKHYAELANSYIEGFENIVTNNTNNIIETGNDCINQLNTTKEEAVDNITTVKSESIASIEAKSNEVLSTVNTGIADINNAKTTAINDIEFVADGEKEEIRDLADDIKENASGIINRVSLSMFDTILKDHILTYEETKGLALQGTWVYKEALAGSRYGYPDFYNKCLEEYNSGEETTISYVDGGASFTARRNENGHIFYDISQKGVVDSLFKYYGYAWFYGVDTENERIFLPRNNYFAIKGSKNSVPVVGNGMSLGLTNGDYNCGLTKQTSGYATIYSGAFDKSVSANASTSGTNAQGTFGVTTDAEKSGIIAKTSDLLNLDETKHLYICVGNTTNYEGMTDVVSQGMEILEQVNLGLETKVDKDSMTEVQCVVETYQNGTSWYRVWSDGWVEQGGRTGSGTSATVTMLKSYSNTNYTVTSANYTDTSTDTGGVGASAYISNLSTNSFRVSQNSVTQWYACGY